MGTVLLLFTGLLALIAGFYTLYTSSGCIPVPRTGATPPSTKTDPDYGFFSPTPGGPLAVGFAAFCTALGFIFAAWMFAFGIIIMMIACRAGGSSSTTTATTPTDTPSRSRVGHPGPQVRVVTGPASKLESGRNRTQRNPR